MVYFIRNKFTTNIKIGHSDVSTQNRMKAFKTAQDCELELLGEIPGEKKVETSLHRRFDHLRIPNVGKEWFRADAELLMVIDRLLNPYPRLMGHEIQSVYLAGRITCDAWREYLLPGSYGDIANSVKTEDDEWFTSRLVEVPGFSGRLDYNGPFWLDVNVKHGTNDFSDHGYGPSSGLTNLDLVRSKSLNGVVRSDLVFAWIDDASCFGTLAEISVAYSHSRTSNRAKVIVVATGKDFRADDMWFVTGMAHYFIEGVANPRVAWDRLWGGDISPVVRKPTAAPAEPDTSMFRVGVKVRMPVYGIGRILAVHGEYPNKMARVVFANGDEKTFILTRSPMEVIEDSEQ